VHHKALVLFYQVTSTVAVARIDAADRFRRYAVHDGARGYDEAFGQDRTSADAGLAPDPVTARQHRACTDNDRVL
jgi:hypothetical protein